MFESRTADSGGREPFGRAVTSFAGLLLLAAAAAGLLGQGAYYPPTQRVVALLVAAAVVLALIGSPPGRGDMCFLVVPASGLAAWAMLDAVLLGVPTGAAFQVMLLVLAVVAVPTACRRLSVEDRDILLVGLTVVGLLVAVTGWFGVAGRVHAWAWEGDGIWRASSTLSYPNATAAVLGPLAILAIARLIERPDRTLLVVAATGLLAGCGATVSRAGFLGLAVGLVVLACLRGIGRTARAAVGPCVGALVATSCLLPSMPAAAPPRPVLALLGLAAGLGIAAIVARLRRLPAAAVLLGALILAGAAALAVGSGRVEGALGTVAHARLNLASPDRTGALRAAVQVVVQHPLTGAGAGQARLRWREPDGGIRLYDYVHNEYVQTAADLGLVGLALLAVLLVALARLLWTARAASASQAGWAGAVGAMAAFAVHSGFDFTWHIPALLLVMLLVAGAVLPAPADTDDPSHSDSMEREFNETQSTK